MEQGEVVTAKEENYAQSIDDGSRKTEDNQTTKKTNKTKTYDFRQGNHDRGGR